MSSAHNVRPESGPWSNLHRKDGCVVAFIVCGLIASSSGLVLQMAGHDANIDARSVITAVPLNPGTLLSTIVSPTSPATSAPDSRQGTASPSNSPQTAPLNAIPAAVTAARDATKDLSRPPAAASHSPQTAPLSVIPTAVTASTREETTGLPQWPAATSNDSQKVVRHPNQRNHGRYDAAAWGRYAPSW